MNQKTSGAKRIFPLHLSPFENYMLCDDHPDFPMAFIIQHEYSGDLDRNAFEIALEETLERHPFFRAIIRPAKQQRDCWVKAGDRKPEVNWGELGEPIELPEGEHLDIRNKIGLRIWIRKNRQRAFVVWQFHHAVCDGIGAYEFMGDVLWSYSRQTCDNPPNAPVDLPAQGLKGRGLGNLEKYLDKTKWDLFKETSWGELSRYVFQKIAPLAQVRKAPASDKPLALFPGFHSFDFDKQQYRAIRLAAQDRGQTTNELLLEHLFYSLERWNKEHEPSHKCGTIGVLLPMDLREVNDKKMPAANHVTYAFLRRNPKEFVDKQKFASGLRKELLSLKHERHDTKFMNLIFRGWKFPKLTHKVLGFHRCFATAVLSHIGDPTKRFHVEFPREKGALRVGNLLLEDISGVPPMRSKTYVTIAIVTYRRVLKICLRCHPNMFSDEDAQKFLDTYVDTISQNVQLPRNEEKPFRQPFLEAS